MSEYRLYAVAIWLMAFAIFAFDGERSIGLVAVGVSCFWFLFDRWEGKS